MAGFFGPTKRDRYEAHYAATKGPVQGAGLRFLRGGSDCSPADCAASDSTEHVAADMAEQAYLAGQRATDALSVTVHREDNAALKLMLQEALGYLQQDYTSPEHAAAALHMTMSAAALTAGDAEAHKAAERALRDLLVWRVQIRAPLNDREQFMQALHDVLGHDLHPDLESALMHAHGRAVGGHFREAFLSRSCLDATRRGGVRGPRSKHRRPKDHHGGEFAADDGSLGQPGSSGRAGFGDAGSQTGGGADSDSRKEEESGTAGSSHDFLRLADSGTSARLGQGK